MQRFASTKILISIWDVMETFDMISCEHVYRENNCQVDSASKEGLQLATGPWKVKDRLENTAYEYYHHGGTAIISVNNILPTYCFVMI